MQIHLSKRQKGLFTFVLLVCIYIFVLWALKLPRSIQYKTVASPEMIENTDISSFAEVTFDRLYYTGVDYLQDGVAIGSYYYYKLQSEDNSLNSRYLLVLAKTTTGQAELSDYTCRFRILDSLSMPNVLSALSAGSHIRYSDIEPMFKPIVVSEVDYPRIAIIVTYSFMIITAIGILLFLVSVFRDTSKDSSYS